MELFWSSGWSLATGIAIGLAIAGLVWAAVGWQRRAEDGV
jgi:hypothetical protein